jgi:hypothetical protein
MLLSLPAAGSAATKPNVVRCSLEDVGGATACIGPLSEAAVSPANGYFGSDWSELLSVDLAGTEGGGTASSAISGLLFSVSTEGTSTTLGTWSASSFAKWSSILLVLVNGLSESSYLIDTSTTSGLWSSVGTTLNGDSTLDSIRVYGNEAVPAQVPLPAAGLLLAGGLALMAALRGHRRP